jgi:hypothetical protein
LQLGEAKTSAMNLTSKNFETITLQSKKNNLASFWVAAISVSAQRIFCQFTRAKEKSS